MATNLTKSLEQKGPLSAPNPQRQPVLKLDQLRVGYGGRALLPPVSLTIHPGELWVVLGPNGSGKSTLLKTALGLLSPVSGTVFIPQTVPVSFVPQRSHIDFSFPMRVIDYVADGLDRSWSFLNPLLRLKHRDTLLQTLREVDLEPEKYKPLRQLSEGQRQRAMLARAIISNPSLLILDEPTSALDIRSERSAFELLHNLCCHRQLAMMVVVHHLHAVAQKATHFLLVDGDHQVVVAGASEHVARNASFVGHYGVFDPCPGQEENDDTHSDETGGINNHA